MADLTPTPPRERRAAFEALAVVLAVLAWSFVLRGPYLQVPAFDGDEALFLMAGKAWVAGHAPYTAVWDVKPPGLFLLYAGVSALFGDNLAGPKIASLAAVAASACGLYAFGRIHLKSRLAGGAAAALYPAYTLLFGGLQSKPELLMTPLLVWGALATLHAAGQAETQDRRLSALAAGALLGCAGMIKQTAIFEAGFFFLVLCLADKGLRGRSLAFIAGCALAPAAFAAWFAAQGLFPPLVQGAILGAAQRVEGDGLAFLKAPLQLAFLLKGAVPLLIGAGLLWVERRRLRKDGPARGLRFVAGWAAASAIGVLALRALYHPYVLPLLAPLALLSGAFLAFLPLPAPAKARLLIALALGAAALAYPVISFQGTDDDASARSRLPVQIGDYLRREALAPGDSIYVVDYEPAVYLLAGAKAPTRFVLPMHLICPFPGTGVRPEQEIARIMASGPRCLVEAANRRRMLCEDQALSRLPDRLGQGRYTIAQRFEDATDRVDVLCRPR